MPSPSLDLTRQQKQTICAPLDQRVFLSGPAGTGKTTTGVERLLHLMESGVPGHQILVLVPQRTIARPYYEVLQSPRVPASGAVAIATISGLARRMVDLFWPLVAGEAGFAHPNRPPVFLTLETAQYYMAHLVQPLLDKGLFDSLVIDRNRLFSQILDTLNKAAVNGFPHTEIGERLKAAWVGDPGQLHIYEDTQQCASLFRQFCLDHNLLDFSLQMEIFLHRLWPAPLCQEFLIDEYRHLIFDNLEEDTPVTADLLQEWLPAFDSALLIYDTDAGYRRFLGADPTATASLADLCEVQTQFEEGFVSSTEISALSFALASALAPEGAQLPAPPDEPRHAPLSITYPIPPIRFYPDMLNWVVQQIAARIEAGTPPGEIVILAPYLSDALRYALVDRLATAGIPHRSHRPSRALREEPAARALLTLAKLAHPQWGLLPQQADVAVALMQAIHGLDPVRARLLTQIVYRQGGLSSFEDIKPEMQDRITHVIGERYEHLRLWLETYSASQPLELDQFLSRLFGEVLSQPEFGFHRDYNAGEIAAALVESVRKFRRVAGETLAAEGLPLGMEYVQMIEAGVIAAQYLSPWQLEAEDAVFLAPAYTFLMSNRPVDYQFWLDVGSRGWYERLYQPLTHPYVLHRDWPIGRPWTDADETAAGQESLLRLTQGLLRRCRQGVYLGISTLSEQGYEHKGELLRAFDRALRQIETRHAG